jgi:hypothetical protein
MSLESGQSLLCDLDEITPLIRSLVTNGEDLCEYGEELPHRLGRQDARPGRQTG